MIAKSILLRLQSFGLTENPIGRVAEITFQMPSGLMCIELKILGFVFKGEGIKLVTDEGEDEAAGLCACHLLRDNTSSPWRTTTPINDLEHEVTLVRWR